jgi:hypothetical protein
LCTAALDATFRGQVGYGEAMAGYQAARDADVVPMYEFTTQLATLEPPPPEVQQVLAAVAGNQAATDDFVGVAAGTVSPAEFFAPDNVGRIMAAGPAIPAQSGGASQMTSPA